VPRGKQARGHLSRAPDSIDTGQSSSHAEMRMLWQPDAQPGVRADVRA